ncbi:MAG: hypothetical protein WD690_08065 [Vicinamibacterales bacterium]
MIRPLDPHEPTPEFMAHLEWQIQSAIRRETRLASPVGGGIRRLRAAAAIAAAVMVGAAGGVASGQIQDARQRQGMIESARAEEQLLRTRHDLAKAEYEDARRRFEVGVAGRESLIAAEQQVRAMEAAIKRLQIDLAEIQATSAPPRNDLDAPLVGKRDFVRDRLMLDLELAQQALAAEERALAETRARVEVGTASDTARLRAEAEVLLARDRMQLLRSRIDLRQRHLRGELEAEALVAAERRTELQLAHVRAQREIALARERLTLLRRQVEVGLAGQLEVKRAEIAILERELELQRIRIELEALGRAR